MRKGFTLIELMIVVAMIGLIVPIIYSVFIYGMLTYDTGAGQVEILRDAQPIILLLQNDIRDSIKVVDEFKNIKTSKRSIILERRNNYVYYHQDKNILIRRVLAKTGEQKEIQRLTQCLKAITFDHDKEPLIAFNLLFLQKISGKPVKLNLTSGIKLRNWREK